eukprot:CAMPEP_0185781460 /NCGR_PEP_ID=MMETSP1174-20130828/102524_1 /TAXON_ID=35687 /ORGANISM="Dictyocha speculum, Strain CCMP1381" /LENGTH=529 /DNA_ID=CAMNT_0028471449 /DNA_START=74 /DNA_END=1663 /DNA_ORIENTATION=+
MRRVMSNSKVASSDSEMDTPHDENTYKVKKSRLISLINWYHVISVFFPYILMGLCGLLIFQFCFSLYEQTDQVVELARATMDTKPKVWFLGWQGTGLTLTVVYFFSRMEPSVYLLEFCCWEAPDDWKVSHDQLIEAMRRQQCYNEESISFMTRLLARSGTGQATAWPPSIVESLRSGNPQEISVENARLESETVIVSVIDQVLKATGTNPKDIDILVINCSLFSPTPSLCALAAHKFGMRSDIESYNLSGMGCSASVISVDLVKKLLKSRPNCLALVVSTENLTQNLYHGNDRSMLLQNILFRCGGAAMLMSNKRSDSLRAKYKLLHTMRKQGTDPTSYECVFECEDDEGNRGVRLSKQIVKVAGRAMEHNFTALGPYVLPVSEQLKVAWAWGGRYVTRNLRIALDKWNMKTLSRAVPTVKPFIPDFKRGIDHFCIHAGGRAVVDGVGDNLRLTADQVEASKKTLYEYGNTSSSSIWYELDYIRNNKKLLHGQRILQLAFGSGFKCNSAVWVCLADGHRNKKVTSKKED